MDSQALSTILGVVIGFLLNAGAEAVRHIVGQKQRREDRNDAFQRETLLALQDAILQSLRVNASLYVNETIAARQSGTWGSTLPPEDMSNHEMIAGGTLNVLMTRVQDETLFTMLTELKQATNSMNNMESKEEADAAFIRVPHIVEKVNERIRMLLLDQ